MFKPQRVVLLKSFEHFDPISMVDKSKNHGKLLSTCFYNRELYILRRGRLFPILSSACARTNVILAGKCGSRRQSTTSFSEHVVVAKTSYQMLQIFSFSDLERAQPPSMEISVLTLVVKNSTKKISEVSTFRE